RTRTYWLAISAWRHRGIDPTSASSRAQRGVARPTRPRRTQLDPATSAALARDRRTILSTIHNACGETITVQLTGLVMCGLMFLHRVACDEQTLKYRIRVALEGLAHRGPDDVGLWCEYPVAIGHCRLAILDLADSRQPMLDPLNRYVLAYNGEAYNFE